jgi:quinol monooxygenase YgiN
MHARPGEHNALRGALVEVTSPSLAEPGCERYDVSQDADDPSTFTVVATWSSPAALEEHVTLPHADRFRAQTENVLATPTSTIMLEPIETATTPS